MFNPGNFLATLLLALLLCTPARATDTLQSISRWRVEVDFCISNIAAGVVFAGEDRENYFMWQVNMEGGNPRLRPHHWRGRSAADARCLGEVPLAGLVDVRQDSTYRLRIDVEDSVATTYINGVLIDVRPNPYGAPYPYGPFAFREDRALRNYFDWEQAYFDNLVVTNLVGGEVLICATFDSEADNPFTAGEVKEGRLCLEAAYAWYGKDAPAEEQQEGWGTEGLLVAIVALLLLIALLLLLICLHHKRTSAIIRDPVPNVAIAATVVNMPKLDTNKPLHQLSPPQLPPEMAQPADDVDPDRRFIEHFNRVIEENLGNADLDIHFLCNKLCLSRTSLYRRVKALYGMSANECIRKQRLARANAMLRSPACANLTIAAIAYDCGFNSLGYFRACFKAEYGCLPNELVGQTDKE